jgi:hypothetical protein
VSSLFDFAKLKDLGGYKAGCLLAVDPELYDKFMIHLNRFVKRDEIAKNMVFLTALSAYTPDPINLFLRGESSTGKTYNVIQALRYFPDDDVWLLGGLSPTALVHSRGVLVDENGEEIDLAKKPVRPRKGDYDDNQAYHEALNEFKEKKERWLERLKNSKYMVDLSKKILVFLEAPHLDTFNMLRPILSHDNWQISYKFTDKTGKGQLQTRHVIIQGWPATLFCTTQEKYIQDLATRGFTITPEMSTEKYKAANKLTAEKAAFPWKFRRGQDFEEMQSYIRFLRGTLENYNVLVPYADSLTEKFPNIFPRSMRDFKHVVDLMKVSALFHFAQRPILDRKIQQIESEKEAMHELYIMASKEDFDRVIGLWKEIEETTETSAPGHIIKFFRQVILEEAKARDEFTIEDLMEGWNSRFEDKKSDYAIRKWVRFLSQIGYVSTHPDPNDKRRNLIRPIKKEEKNDRYGLFELSRIFKLESFKEWLNEANQICAHNQVLLRINFLEDQETPVGNIYRKYYLNENNNFAHISLGDSQASSNEKAQEIRASGKRPQLTDFRNFKQLVRLTTPIIDKCAVCGFQGRMDCQVTMPDDSWALLCGKCGLELTEKT